jgi:ABC-type phosphate transport system permease subunit
MFEHHRQPMLPRADFLRRQMQFAALAFSLVGGSLVMGVLGYRIFEGLDWLDALVNASMLLGGMGPVNELHTVAGKLFASFYALYSGMIFLIAVGVLFAPLLHRFLHHFHLELEADAPAEGDSASRDEA